MLDQLFGEHNVPSEQINGILHLMDTLYGERLQTFRNRIQQCKDPLIQTFIYLVVLNNEQSLQQYLLRTSPTQEQKLTTVYVYLHTYTEELLDNKKTMKEYLNSCKEAWFLA